MPIERPRRLVTVTATPSPPRLAWAAATLVIVPGTVPEVAQSAAAHARAIVLFDIGDPFSLKDESNRLWKRHASKVTSLPKWQTNYDSVLIFGKFNRIDSRMNQ
jgi:hypothetical protein